jgi:hypothetical protein
VSRANPVATTLAHRIGCIADPEVRVRYLQTVLASMPVGDVADVLTVALHATEARDSSQGALLLACCVALSHEGSAPIRTAIAAVARDKGQLATAAMLTPGEGRAVDEPIKTPDLGLGRPVTLGERKSLARRRDRDLLARVMRDPHPDVIRILLRNPALTEDDVLRLCAQRPIEGDVLREVFRCTRWIVRYRVRRSIVLNPFAPIDLALQLAPHLDLSDARMLLDDPSSAEALRDVCRRVALVGTLH